MYQYACHPPISQLCPFREEIKLWNYQVSIQKTESAVDILSKKKLKPRELEDTQLEGHESIAREGHFQEIQKHRVEATTTSHSFCSTNLFDSWKDFLSFFFFSDVLYFLLNYIIPHYSFLFFLIWAALSLHCCTQAFSSCSERGQLLCRLLTVVASLIAEHWL